MSGESPHFYTLPRPLKAGSYERSDLDVWLSVSLCGDQVKGSRQPNLVILCIWDYYWLCFRVTGIQCTSAPSSGPGGFVSCDQRNARKDESKDEDDLDIDRPATSAKAPRSANIALSPSSR
jgi:hypothetical protein